MIIETSNDPKRVIYFKGIMEDDNSIMIAKICKDYETITKLITGECATRTLSNLYNLHTVRGLTNNKKLILDASMSGPHHYYGHISPTNYHTIKIVNNQPIYTSYNNIKYIETIKMELPKEYVYKCNKYNWIKGINITNKEKNKYNLHKIDKKYINTDTTAIDSLFSYTGILELEEEYINLKIIDKPYLYDLTKYKIKIVKNDEPFIFNQTEINKYKHTQHKLRIITYNYGKDYFKEYILKKNGAFIEQHEFIQCITPINELCGGYAISGRFIDNELELIGFRIPFGYTLLVEPYVLHGDSSLIGLYSMGMTGNHNAMSTADTVLIKNKITSYNVQFNTDISKYETNELMITTTNNTTKKILELDNQMKNTIYEKLNVIQKMAWRHAFFTNYFFALKTIVN